MSKCSGVCGFRDRAGLHSIRVNDQGRVCFGWTAEGPEHFRIVDYH